MEKGVHGCHEVLCFNDDEALGVQQLLTSSKMQLCRGWLHLCSWVSGAVPALLEHASQTVGCCVVYQTPMRIACSMPCMKLHAAPSRAKIWALVNHCCPHH